LNPLAKIIAGEVRKSGIIPFARFMELALYCPVYGYYEKEADTVGRSGDFVTSVSVGRLFGELLAFQFADWLGQMTEPTPHARCRTPMLRIVEAGAHDGGLCEDILCWLRKRRTRLRERIEYWIIEPSGRRRERQQIRLERFAPRVRWFSDFHSARRQCSGLEPREPWLDGIIFSNELLDAMPVHRLGWDASKKHWFEWGVAFESDHFVWAKMPKLDPRVRIPACPPVLLECLPDGFIVEICTAADTWWTETAGVLRQGKLLTIDYGASAEEIFASGQKGGTLRAYHRHRVTDDVLTNPGGLDITAHVNFTAIQTAGESAGLKTEALVSQARFLTQIAQKTWEKPAGFGEWASAHTRQFQTLTHPEHLGRSFLVLVQSR
jgi:SAM-dependent MidA family methyltransferase